MRKNRTKHEAKKPRLAKRALALCFALIFVCSCLLPVFAHSEEGALTDTAVVEEQDEQKLEDSALLNEGGENPTEGGEDSNEEPKNEEPKPAEPEQKPEEPKVEEQPKTEGTTEESKDTTGETKPEEQLKTEGTTEESKDSTEEQPKNEGTTEESKDTAGETKPEEPKQPTTNTTGDTIEQGKATYTYRFWPDKIDAFDLEAINADVKSGTSLNDAAQSRARMVPCTVLTVMTNANLRDYQANVQQPTKSGYEFAGWYTVDGTAEDEFSFEQSLNFEESKTIDVFAKWEKVESTVEDEMEKTEPTTEDELEKTESGKDSESKEETLPPVEKTGAVSLMIDEDETVSIALKAENLPGKVNELVVTDLNEDEEGAAFGKAFKESNYYTDWTPTNLMVNITPEDIDGNTVQPSGAVRVTISDLSQLSIGTENIGEWKVLHLTKNNEIEALDVENTTTAVDSYDNTVLNSITFETTSFSPFVVVAKGKVVDTLASAVNINVRQVKTLDSRSTGGTWRVTSGWDSVVITTDTVAADNSGHPYAVDTDTSQRTTTVIEGIAPGEAVVQYYNTRGKLVSTFNIHVNNEVEVRTAEIYYMSSPNTDPASVDQGAWGPSGFGLAKVELPASAVWRTGSNNTTKIVLNPENYVTKWPDGTNGTSYLLDKSVLFPSGNVTAYSHRNGKYQVYQYGDGRDMERQAWYYIAENWLETLRNQYNVSNLTINDIQDISIVPKKLSKNNIGGQDTGTGFGNYDWHLDCGVSVEVTDTYTVRFYIWDGETWVLKSKATQIVLENQTAFDPTKTNDPKTKYDIDLKDANGGDLSGWSLEHDAKGNIGDTETFPYTVNHNLDFYARYVPVDTKLEQDDPYIFVEKEVKGLTNVGQLQSNFCITIGGKSYDLNSRAGNIITTGDGFKIRWKVDVDAGTYTVGENHYTVNGYKVDVEVNGTPVTDVTNPSVSVDVTKNAFVMTHKIITKNSENTFDFGVSGGSNHIFIISTGGKGSNKKRNIIISKEPLSVLERASVEKTLEELQTGPGSSFANNGQNEFYSLKNQHQIVVDHGIITYDDGNKQVTISNTSEWNKVMGLIYSVEKGNNPEVSITNTYTLNTTNVTITKKTTGAFADRAKAFRFTVSGLNTGATLKRADGTIVTGDNFTLSNGQSVTIENLEVGKIITITEDENDSKDYDTTDTCHKEKAKSFKYKVCLGEDGKIYLQALDENGNAIADKTITGEKLGITVTNNFDGNPDTGVLLDTLPYLILLAVAVAGGVLVVVRKRKHRDE